MINQAQQKEINRYLKLLDAKEQEIYNEFYDHIMTGYDEMLVGNPELAIKDYLQHEFLPAFGGTRGIKKIINNRNKEAQKFYRNQLWANFLSYFRWPMMLVVLAIYFIVKQCFVLFETKQVFMWGVITLSLIPMLLTIGGYASFYIQCRVRKLPYVSSIKNKSIMILVFIISWIAQFPNWMKVVYGREIIWVESPASTLLFSMALTLIAIFSLSYLKLMRQHFDFKFKLA